MTLLQRIAREPNAIFGLIAASYGLLVVFNVLVLSAQQVGAFVTFGGAVVFLLRWLTTPASEVVAQRQPGGVTVTGKGASVNPGIPVEVTTLPLGEVAADDERGATDAQTVLIVLVLLLVVLIFFGVGVNVR